MELTPIKSLLTDTPEQGRQLALNLAQHSIHAMQPDEEKLKAGRPKYSTDPDSLIAASHVVAVEFATIAAANNYWR
ncbi:MAG TPA: hexameric tyrosine-coordinated heme protein [Phycisphaerae bacterium]|nr:hexameric tyrosine-coordinated heme protein [Phycisphaerales bacterium]HRX83873.1 hexameric tyrosine-coordinated heme protein [Phycisphaerae bacterium]